MKITQKQAKMVFVAVLGLVVLALLTAFISERQRSSEVEAPDVIFQDNETGIEQFEDGTVFIDVAKATDGQAPQASSSITVTNTNATMAREFMMIGAWRGHQFRYDLWEDDLNDDADHDLVMKAHTTLLPEDDVVEAFIAPQFNETNGDEEPTGLRFQVYVDQQFMDDVEDPQLRWGYSLEHNRSFQPEEIRDGIYVDEEIMENVEALKAKPTVKPHIFVGEWPERIKGSLTLENETYIHTY